MEFKNKRIQKCTNCGFSFNTITTEKCSMCKIPEQSTDRKKKKLRIKTNERKVYKKI